MDDRKSVTPSQAAVLQAIKRFALEQGVEDSVNVNSEAEHAGRQICAACGSSAQVAVLPCPRRKTCPMPRGQILRRNLPGTIITIIIITITISRETGARKRAWGLIQGRVERGPQVPAVKWPGFGLPSAGHR